MNAVGQTGVPGFLARFDGLRDRLPGDRAARAQAADYLRQRGWPTMRDEAWRYTNLRALDRLSFSEPLTCVGGRVPFLGTLPAVHAPRIVMVDGRLRLDLSELPARAKVGAFAGNAVFGALANPERDRMVALNTMLAEDGAVIEVAAGDDAGLVLLVSLASDASGRATAFHPRHAIRLGAGARLTLLEISVGEGAYLHNPVTEIHVEAGAVLTHVRLQDESSDAYHLSTLYADIAGGGTYDSFTLNLGGRIVRSEMHARLAGAHAATHLNGAQLLGGAQHSDLTTVVSHDAPNCASRQTVKNVLSGRSRGVFQGRIEVARIAQKTDGYQMNQALLLSPEAEIDCKPELRIFADDVKCSHGATVGELDAAQLFYLRSRGVLEAEARTILVRAFLAEAFDAIDNETIRGVLDDSVSRWWERQSV